jgi:hypothetical protein
LSLTGYIGLVPRIWRESVWVFSLVLAFVFKLAELFSGFVKESNCIIWTLSYLFNEKVNEDLRHVG